MNVCATCKFFKKSTHEFAGASGISSGWCNIKMPMGFTSNSNSTAVDRPNSQGCDFHMHTEVES